VCDVLHALVFFYPLRNSVYATIVTDCGSDSKGDFMITSNGFFQSTHNFETSVHVEDALRGASESRFNDVSAVAFFGIVELSGTVSSYYDKAQALRIAGRVPGVTTVVESLEIRPTTGSRRETAERRPRPIHFNSHLINDHTSTRLGLANG